MEKKPNQSGEALVASSERASFKSLTLDGRVDLARKPDASPFFSSGNVL